MSIPTARDTKARMIENKHQPKAPLPPTSVLHSPGQSWGANPAATVLLALAAVEPAVYLSPQHT